MRKFVLTNFQDYEALAFNCAYKALIVECIRRSIHGKELEDDRDSRYFVDGHFWMQDSIQSWKERFPYLGMTTIKKYIKELCDIGYVIRKKMNTRAGRSATFYRINPEMDLFLKIQSAKQKIIEEQSENQNSPQEPHSQNPTTPMVGNRPSQSRNPTVASLITNISLIHRSNISSPAVPPEIVFDDSDKFAKLFRLLTLLPKCKQDFRGDEYRRYMEELMKKLEVTLEELETCACEWQEYHNEAKKKPKAIKASFRTWVQNFVQRRNERRERQQRSPGTFGRTQTTRASDSGWDWPAEILAAEAAAGRGNHGQGS